MGLVYDFVKTLPADVQGFENPEAQFLLLVPMPRKVFDQMHLNLEEVALVPKALVTVSELD